MPRIKLFHVSVGFFVMSLALVLYLAVDGKLAWAIDALRLYASGSTTTPTELLLEGSARNRMQVGGDAAEIRDLLDRAVSIDPNSSALYMLGELDLREGDDASALERFRSYLEKDPSYLPAYWRLAEIHERAGDRAARLELLSRGLDYFLSEADRFVPRVDDSVPTNFNEKAEAVHNYYLEAIVLLRQELEAEGDGE